MYAYIIYQKDGVRKIVHTSDIKDYNPRSASDFNPNEIVRAYWRGTKDEIPVLDARRYNAQVLLLGGEFEHIEDLNIK